MNIVVDASVIIIAVIVDEPEKNVLVELTKGADLIAPHSVHWEIGNAFSAMLKRKRIVLNQGLRALEIYRNIPIKFLDVELEESLKIADRLGIYAYAAYLIRCALKYKSPLIALDQNLVSFAKQMNVKVMEVT
ncbi:MAG: type II toxin-antitoxin system VapC family toxin [Candidatus Desantisbacteria bacterium]